MNINFKNFPHSDSPHAHPPYGELWHTPRVGTPHSLKTPDLYYCHTLFIWGLLGAVICEDGKLCEMQWLTNSYNLMFKKTWKNGFIRSESNKLPYLSIL